MWLRSAATEHGELGMGDAWILHLRREISVVQVLGICVSPSLVLVPFITVTLHGLGCIWISGQDPEPYKAAVWRFLAVAESNSLEALDLRCVGHIV